MQVERSSWTIKLVSFQIMPIRVGRLCCNAQPYTALRDEFVLQCETTGRASSQEKQLAAKPFAKLHFRKPRRIASAQAKMLAFLVLT
jgi:hypothetical protein